MICVDGMALHWCLYAIGCMLSSFLSDSYLEIDNIIKNIITENSIVKNISLRPKEVI